jgi:glycosyltransferase involved in cell wall biosynthesis
MQYSGQRTAMREKLLIYAGNPTQYHAPLFRAMTDAYDFEVEVMFGDEIGAKPFYNPELRSVIEWDVPVTAGYQHRFFRNLSSEDRKGFWSRNNPEMIRYVMKSDASHVLIHGYDTLSAWYVYFASILSGKTIIWRGEAFEQKGPGKTLTRTIKGLVLPAYFKACTTVLYSCIPNRDYLAKFLGRETAKMVSFPCAVDNDFFQSLRVRDSAELAKIRDEYAIPPDHMVVATCCRLTKRKRVDLLIRAVAGMKDRKVSVLICGDGPEREVLEALARELGVNLAVAGFVGQRIVARLLSIADVFALLSSYDASPKALNEAMNFPIPMIVSDGVGTAIDLVHDGVNGYVFRDDGPHQLMRWLDDFAADPASRRAMGGRNAEILKGYSFDVDVANLRQAMQEAA